MADKFISGFDNLCPKCGGKGTLEYGALLPSGRNHMQCLKCGWTLWDDAAAKLAGYRANT